MRNTNNKKEYRRLLAILQKVEGRYYVDIANEHGVTAGLYKRASAYIKKGIDGVRIEETWWIEIQHNRRKQRDYSISII